MGSASELDYHLLLARDLELLDKCSYDPLQREVEQVKRMLTGLIAKLSTEN
jgi:four helix bundle protein